MRVGYLVSQYPTPAHTFIRREAEALRARGIEVHFFSIRGANITRDATQIERAAQAETFYVLKQSPLRYARDHTWALLSRPAAYVRTLMAAFRHRVPGLRAVVWSMAYFAEAIVLAAEVERRKLDVLHNQFANAGAITGFLTTRFLGMPWGLSLHGVSETEYPAGVLLGAKLAAADYAACVSYFGAAQAMRGLAGQHWHKLFISRCGIDLAAMPERTRVAGSRTRIICVARLSPDKGHLGLLQAFQRAASHSDVDLVLVGDGPLRAEVEATISRLGLDGRVTLLGALSEQATLREIAQSDILVLASLMEGLPVVLMEGMALGLPVVGPRVAGIPELVEHGTSGLLFTPAKWEDLADKLTEILAMDQTQWQAFGDAGRAKIEREFEIGVAVAPLADRLQRFAVSAPDVQGVGAVKRTRTSTGRPATTSR